MTADTGGVSTDGMTKVDVQVGKTVAAYRRRLGYSQRKVAVWLRTTQPTVARKERGHIPFSADELVELAYRLDVPVGDFMPAADVERSE